MARILAAIDASAYAASVCDHAAWFATRTGGPVELLHVTNRDEGDRAQPNVTGDIGLGASSGCTEELATIDKTRVRTAQDHARVLLAMGRKRLLEAGVGHVQEKQCNREVTEAVTALEGAADLVVIGKQGESSNYTVGHLGSQAEGVIRASIRPILIVPRTYMPITRIVAAFDGGRCACKALEHVLESAAFIGMPCLVVIVSSDARQDSRLSEQAHAIIGGHPNAVILGLRGQVAPAIAGQLRSAAGDILIMGAYNHSRIHELIIGSTTSLMVRTVKVPVLLFR